MKQLGKSMCGLFGHTISLRDSFDHSEQALNSLAHRGPDQCGIWTDDNVFIGHRRLSILDLSEYGKQPMSNKKNNVILTANGEIYNYLPLRKDLSQDYVFQSYSDSEVILHGYCKWGIDELLSRLDGMFAFCIYDQVKGKIFLVRDHAGIKPLYYSYINEQLIWASELKAIKKYLCDRLPQTDVTAIYDFFCYGYIPAPKTMYQQIYKVESAHYIVFDIFTKQLDVKRYWQLEPNPVNISLTDAVEKFQDLLFSNVSSQMMSDVPVGFFLSGGMDSSSVVAAAAQTKNQLFTFTIGFDDVYKDERPYALELSRYYNTLHTEKVFTSDDTNNLFSQLMKWYDEPFADTSAFPTYLVCKLARQRVTVALSGDGGDELFGGYQRYAMFLEKSIDKFDVISLIAQIVTKIPYLRQSIKKARHIMEPIPCIRKLVYELKLHKLIGQLSYEAERSIHSNDLLEMYLPLLTHSSASERYRYREILNIPKDYDDYWYFRKYWCNDLPLPVRLQYLDFHTYLPEDVLTKVDRTSMAVSLEVRVPMLARSMVDFAFSLPIDILWAGGELKGLLKKAMKDFLPHSILHHEKQGFGINTQKGILNTDQPIPFTIYEKLFSSTRDI